MFPCSVFGDKALYIVYIGKYIIEVLFFFSPRFTFFFLENYEKKKWQKEIIQNKKTEKWKKL